MANDLVVARPYAKAIFAIALANNKLQHWSEILNMLAFIAKDSRIKALLSDPRITWHERAALFTDICGKTLDTKGKNLVQILAMNRRLAILPEIAEFYEQLQPQPLGIYERIKEIIEIARGNIARVVNTEMVSAYWHIGREIVEEEQKGETRAAYGEKLISTLAERLSADFGKGFDPSNLWNMRKFYKTYPILDTVCRELSWSQYRILMRIEKPEARSFYEIECVKNNWSIRELERQKCSLLFERLALSKDKIGLMELAKKGQELQTYEDMIKDPYVLEFTGLPPQIKLYETKLEQALIDNLSKFLLELGSGFSFIARQKRISLDGDHFYIDLVFYNTILKCYVLLDLKIGKLVHQDIGQMQMYVNYYDRDVKLADDNPTVGLILCDDKKDAVVKYTLSKDNKQIFASRYKLYLPSEEELIKELKNNRFLLDRD